MPVRWHRNTDKHIYTYNLITYTLIIWLHLPKPIFWHQLSMHMWRRCIKPETPFICAYNTRYKDDLYTAFSDCLILKWGENIVLRVVQSNIYYTLGRKYNVPYNFLCKNVICGRFLYWQQISHYICTLIHTSGIFLQCSVRWVFMYFNAYVWRAVCYVKQTQKMKPINFV